MQQVETLRSLIGSVMSYLMYFFIALVVLLIKLYPQHAEEIRRVYEPKG